MFENLNPQIQWNEPRAEVRAPTTYRDQAEFMDTMGRATRSGSKYTGMGIFGMPNFMSPGGTAYSVPGQRKSEMFARGIFGSPFGLPGTVMNYGVDALNRNGFNDYAGPGGDVTYAQDQIALDVPGAERDLATALANAKVWARSGEQIDWNDATGDDISAAHADPDAAGDSDNIGGW